MMNSFVWTKAKIGILGNLFYIITTRKQKKKLKDIEKFPKAYKNHMIILLFSLKKIWQADKI